MAIREILVLPHPALKTICDPVEAVDDETRQLMDDMLETMYDDNGIGLSANQVGVLKRVLVMDVPKGCWEYSGTDKDGVLICQSKHRDGGEVELLEFVVSRVSDVERACCTFVSHRQTGGALQNVIVAKPAAVH